MVDPLSLVDSAQPSRPEKEHVEEPSFCDYCMVCDKLIPEKVKGNVAVDVAEGEEPSKKPKKKPAGGKVYVSGLGDGATICADLCRSRTQMAQS